MRAFSRSVEPLEQQEQASTASCTSAPALSLLLPEEELQLGAKQFYGGAGQLPDTFLQGVIMLSEWPIRAATAAHAQRQLSLKLAEALFQASSCPRTWSRGPFGLGAPTLAASFG